MRIEVRADWGTTLLNSEHLFLAFVVYFVGFEQICHHLMLPSAIIVLQRCCHFCYFFLGLGKRVLSIALYMRNGSVWRRSGA